MVKEIVRDPLFLSMKSTPAGISDVQTAMDLDETLTANRDRCVGMAANMIGVNKRIIVFNDKGKNMIMLNPVIVKASGEYEATEGCLSLDGERKTKRFSKIQVRYNDLTMREKTQTYSGWTAEIIQHEVDHLDGILI